MLKVFDAYSVRARLLPAILGMAPALAAILLLIPWKEFGLYSVATGVAMLGLVYALSDWARRRGQALEPELYEELGGKPSVTMMYRSDQTLDSVSKDRYRTFIASQIKTPEPSEITERNDRASANSFYELAGTWLRTQTRDRKKFPILFDENCSYGFRRNLLGVKGAALALNLLVVVTCAGVLSRGEWLQFDADVHKRILVVLLVTATHALYFLLAVRQRDVSAASRTYARELILSCETLMKTPGTRALSKGKTKDRTPAAAA
jgi:hypothetical protein